MPTARQLVESSASLNAACDRGDAFHDRALRWAAYNGHLPVVQLLLQHGAAVHALDDLALRYAAHYGHLPVVQLLLQHGADLSKLTKEQLQQLNLSNQELKGLAKQVFQ